MKQVILGNTTPGWPGFEIEFDRKIDFFVDNYSNLDINSNSFKILYLKEAEIISKLKKQAIENQHLFDAIITLDEEVLEKCKNAHFLPIGTCWIWNYVGVDKKFQISHLTGHKDTTDGHRLRKKIHYKQEKIITPKDFYISQHGGVENFCDNKILGEKKEPLFDSQFHICIENDRQNNYFTEKLIDCFVTKTIPIYWGCPNIEKFFNTDGMFVAQSFEDIINICNNINENSYFEKLWAVEYNYDNCKKYCTIVDRLEEIVKNILQPN